MRRFSLLAAVIGMTVALLAPAAGAAEPYCGIRWGSQPKSVPEELSPGPVAGARAGRHECYDRFVVDIANNTEPTGYTVAYVPQVYQEGSGEPIPLRGGAYLNITVNAPAYDGGGEATVDWTAGDDVVDVSGFRTFRQAVFGGSFEGYTQFGLGVRARLPFRVFRLVSGPGEDASTRLVIDVAHRW
jgi:hypothetical protein